MTGVYESEILEWLVVAILVGVAVLAALTAFAFDELRWPRRYASRLFFACLFAHLGGRILGHSSEASQPVALCLDSRAETTRAESQPVF